MIEINRNGAVTKFNYDGMGMLVEKILPDGKSEKWAWDGMALVARGDDIYVNEAHIAGGTPILTKTDKGIRYHASDFLGTTLWSSDMKGNIVDSYSDTSVFGEGSIQHDRSARFTGKPYDEDLQAFVFPFRNYKPDLARWSSSDPAGFPDGINNHFYACVPTISLDPLGLKFETNGNAVADKVISNIANSSYGKDSSSSFNQLYNDPNNTVNVVVQDRAWNDGGHNHYDQSTNTIYISPSDAASNDGYVLQGADGNPVKGKTSIESMFVHEAQHAYDKSKGVDLSATSDGKYGDIKNTDTNAIDEANKYRNSVGEAPRLWYRWMEDYLANKKEK